jgi:hypothetical protein
VDSANSAASSAPRGARPPGGATAQPPAPAAPACGRRRRTSSTPSPALVAELSERTRPIPKYSSPDADAGAVNENETSLAPQSCTPTMRLVPTSVV